MIFAIDFDSTLFEEWYPDVGPMLPHAKEVVNWLYNQGHTIIIWTCREGEVLDAAIEALDLNGVKYHYVNVNDPERIKRYGWDSRKLGCDVMIDDRCLFFKNNGVDWYEIEKMIKQYLANGTSDNLSCGRVGVGQDPHSQSPRG